MAHFYLLYSCYHKVGIIVFKKQRTFRAFQNPIKNQKPSIKILLIIDYYPKWVKRQFFTTSKISNFLTFQKLHFFLKMEKSLP